MVQIAAAMTLEGFMASPMWEQALQTIKEKRVQSISIANAEIGLGGAELQVDAEGFLMTWRDSGTPRPVRLNTAADVLKEVQKVCDETHESAPYQSDIIKTVLAGIADIVGNAKK